MRSYFSFIRCVKSANSALFKDFYKEVEMKKNKQDGGSYFIIIPKTYTAPYLVTLCENHPF